MKLNKQNYLPRQYKEDEKLPINHNYLKEQFKDSENIISDIKKLINKGDYTLGCAVNDVEDRFKKITNSKYAIGVGSGTDAIILSLRAIGIKKNDEVITSPYTFYATVGAIVTTGAKPIFVDINNDYNIDVGKIEAAITPKTKAIVPVHWSGLICDMKKIPAIAKKYNLYVIEDACHAINAERDGKKPGTYSKSACFSLHPLKNLNVWGDGGFIVTNSEKFYEKLVLLRNHGLIDRNTCKIFTGNSRLDTLQAIVAIHLIKKIDHITDKRIANANFFDEKLSSISEIIIPSRFSNAKQVFHIYVIRTKKRDELRKYLIDNGIDAKIHYPIPMHLQPAAKEFEYKEGDFPNAELTCMSVLSLPVHEFISKEQQNYVIQKIKNFFKNI